MRTSKTLRFIDAAIQTPPFSVEARYEAGKMLRKLQDGESLSMPISRPMPSIGAGCHELRIRDEDRNWRIVYYIAPREIVVIAIFAKKTQTTPLSIIEQCRKALKEAKEE